MELWGLCQTMFCWSTTEIRDDLRLLCHHGGTLQWLLRLGAAPTTTFKEVGTFCATASVCWWYCYYISPYLPPAQLPGITAVGRFTTVIWLYRQTKALIQILTLFTCFVNLSATFCWPTNLFFDCCWKRLWDLPSCFVDAQWHTCSMEKFFFTFRILAS